MENVPILPPSAIRPPTQSLWPTKTESLLDALRTNFAVSTWLLMGACLQSLLFLLLPTRYALTGAALLLSLRFLNKCLIALGLLRNPAMAGVIMKKTTAQVRDKHGNYSVNSTSGEKIVVLLLGFKSNHPFGIFAPGFREIGDYFHRMSVELSEGAADNGFLGQTSWASKDRTSCPELLHISYWRDLASVQAFAHSPLHREAWDHWNRTVKQHDFLGIHHEVYEADAGHWENVYANFQPTGLGATSYLRKRDSGKLEGGQVPDEWISPLIAANRGKLSTMSGRLGTGTGNENDKYGKNVYL